MAYVLTGATGHIGNNLARMLTSQNEKVKLLVRKIDESIEGLDVEYIVGNVFDKEFLLKNIEKDDIVIHLAGIIDIKNKLQKETYDINFMGAVKVTNAAIEKKAKRYIYCSTVDCIYKENEYDIVKEPARMRVEMFNQNYPISKARATEYVLNKMKEKPYTSIAIIYPSCVFGIHDYKPSAIGKVIVDAIKGKTEFGINGGYNFIDVEDVVKAIITLSKMDNNDSYILSGHNITVRQMYETINNALGVNRKIRKMPLFLVKLAIPFVPYLSKFTLQTITENHNYDNSKAIKELNLELTPFDISINNTINWFKNKMKGKEENED